MKAILYMHQSGSMAEDSVDEDNLLFVGREFARQSGDEICAIFWETENADRTFPMAAEAYGLANRLDARILVVGLAEIDPFDDRLTVAHGPQIIHLGISESGRLETAAEKSTPESNFPTLLPEGAYAIVVTEDDDCKLFTPTITEKNANEPIPYLACVLIAVANKLGDEDWTDTLVKNEFPDAVG